MRFLKSSKCSKNLTSVKNKKDIYIFLKMSNYRNTVFYDYQSRFLVIFSSNYWHRLVLKLPLPNHIFSRSPANTTATNSPTLHPFLCHNISSEAIFYIIKRVFWGKHEFYLSVILLLSKVSYYLCRLSQALKLTSKNMSF